MITKLLDGLEMFLGVFVTSLNSSKLQMAGGGIYIGLQVELAIYSRYPTFCTCTGVSEGIAPVHPVTLSHGVVVGSLTADVVSPDRPVPSHRCNSSLLQLPRHYTGASSGAPPVQPVLNIFFLAT